MAIWAIANIVRNMSLADGSAICDGSAGTLNSTPSLSVNETTQEQTMSSGNQNVTHMMPSGPTDELAQRRQRVDTPQPEFDPVIESEFLFQEIDNHEMVATLGTKPSTKSLELELGTVNMDSLEVAKLHGGVVVALQESVEDEVLIRLQERVVARGRMTVVNGKIAVRISESFV